MLWNLVGLDQLCCECNLSPNYVKFLSEERGGRYEMSNMFVGWHVLGREAVGEAVLIIWRIVASAGFCGHLLSYTHSLC